MSSLSASLYFMVVQPHQKLTYEDFLKMPEDNLRREIIDGELLVNAAPVSRHQRIVGLLYYRIREFLEQNPGVGEIFVAPLDVLLSQFDVVEPDLVFVAEADSGIVTARNVQGLPTLLIEVMSDPAVDRRRKKDLYEKFGVPEYWIVDQARSEVEIYVLSAGAYGEPSRFRSGDVIRSDKLPGFSFEVVELKTLPD